MPTNIDLTIDMQRNSIMIAKIIKSNVSATLREITNNVIDVKKYIKDTTECLQVE